MVQTYSVLKLFTGLAIAAFIASKLIVKNAINIEANPASANTHHDKFVRYAKSCSHLSIPYHASGAAITNAINTSFIKSIDNKLTILETLAPSTFRTPISFVCCMVL